MMKRLIVLSVLAIALTACQPTQPDPTSQPTPEPAVGLESPLEAAAPTVPVTDDSSAPAPPESPSPVPLTQAEPEFSEALRADYNGIDLEGRSEDQLAGDDPVALAQAMFGAKESMEGNYRESSEVEMGNERSVVIFTQENLPDDSVQAIRTRLEFFRIDGPWQLQWAGEQYRCREGRGQQDWAKELCS